MEYTLREGNYEKLGAHCEKGAVTFTFEGEKEDTCAILLYNKALDLAERIPVPQEYCIGAIRSVCVSGIDKKDLVYNYERNGTIVTDPYATKIIGREIWNDSARSEKNYALYAGMTMEHFKWQEDKNPEIPRHEMIMYKLHVRGFSMDSALRSNKRGTFRAIIDRIPYLKQLGVTTIELMPVYEFEEIALDMPFELPAYLKWQSSETDLIRPDTIQRTEKINYWGYAPGNYFAVKASYSSIPEASEEFKELIRQLHKNNMECIMEMYFPKEVNPCIVPKALHFWVREYHIDGFHLMGEAVHMETIAQDLLLRRTKLFYDVIDAALMDEKSSYPHLFVYNDEYLYPMRKMLNHINGTMEEFICQQRKQHSSMGFVNYMAGTNGFTLLDIFSYQEKHNEENGEENRDGTNWNFSNNYGAEGRTGKRYINEIRELMLRNAIAVLMLGQGVPLLLAGDEAGNSQNGNNNPYCQDNETGWVNFKQAKKYAWLTDFAEKMIRFRKAHPVLTSEEPKKLSDYNRKGLPDLSYHGENAWLTSVTCDRQLLGMMYNGTYSLREDGTEDDFVYVGYNFQCSAGELALPKLPGRKSWYLVMDTARGRVPFLEEEEKIEERKFVMEKQSVVLLLGK